MLTELQLENFKPFMQRQRLPLAPITLLYGPNSGGKSSIMQSLLLLKQTLADPPTTGTSLLARGPDVDLGSFQAFVHRHDLSKPLTLAVSFTMVPGSEVRPSRQARRNRKGRCTVNLTFGPEQGDDAGIGQSGRVSAVGLHFEGPTSLDCVLVPPSVDDATAWERRRSASPWRLWFEFQDHRSLASFARYVAGLENEHVRLANCADPSLEEIRASLAGAVLLSNDGLLPMHLEVPPPEAAGDPPLDEWLSLREGYLEDQMNELKRQFRALTYLGPLRAYPERYHVLASGRENTVGMRGEYTPEAVIRDQAGTKKRVNAWFKTFDIPYELDVRSIADKVAGDLVVMTLTDKRTGTTVTPLDVGFGIGQLLPIIVEAGLARGRTLCVEQPEIHLHPRLQADLADLFIETSRPTHRKGVQANRWIVETHSETLMLRLQRRIREGRLLAKDVSVLYIEPMVDVGSQVIPLRLDEDGAFLDEWPGGFFEESYREIVEDGT